MSKLSDFTEEETKDMVSKIQDWFSKYEEKLRTVGSSQWLDWVINKLKDYPALCDEDVAYDESWSQEDKDKFFLISTFHDKLMSICKELNTPYEDEEAFFETYETNFIYKEKPYHIFTMIGQGAITSIKNGFEDLDKFPAIEIDSYYANN